MNLPKETQKSQSKEKSEDQLVKTSGTNQKVKPPFPKVPAFVIVAIILSYYGYDKKCKALLLRLNRNSSQYFKNHGEILKAFLKLKPLVRGYATDSNYSNLVFGRRSMNKVWNLSKAWYQD